jgi:hypothetical protein
MKRPLSAIVPLGLLTGIALTTQTLILASGIQSANPGSPTRVPIIQLDRASIPEPLSIVLSSLAVLGWTTFLRRNRVNR